eukprot:TRINITY_DN1611_c0_g1_i1.p1 TRINITY_DN1611_c0_g1~~TRINITY_DN1611_c0_g1_i1.p1  ORF type:complete len:356 (+),score=38.87 TRINITY_DN1611_c0_g1_i1:81-1148(+)
MLVCALVFILLLPDLVAARSQSGHSPRKRVELYTEACFNTSSSESERIREMCCSSVSGDRACFDDMFTKDECCATGRAAVWPPLLPAVASDSSPHTDHDGKLWYRAVRNATGTMTTKLLGVTITVKFFKAWRKMVAYHFSELGNDGYRLKKLKMLSGHWAIDLGGNLGMITILLLKLNPGLRVITVEPSPSLFRYLKWNLEVNGVADRCIALNVGIAAKGVDDGTVMKLYQWTSGPDSSNFARVRELDGRPWVVETVPTLSFKSLLKRAQVSYKQVKFMKVDCEGCEWSLVQDPEFVSRIGRKDGIALAAELHLTSNYETSPRKWASLQLWFCGTVLQRWTDPTNKTELTCTRGF